MGMASQPNDHWYELAAKTLARPGGEVFAPAANHAKIFYPPPGGNRLPGFLSIRGKDHAEL